MCVHGAVHGKGKARKACEFGVKAVAVILHRSGLMVGARNFPGKPVVTGAPGCDSIHEIDHPSRLCLAPYAPVAASPALTTPPPGARPC